MEQYHNIFDSHAHYDDTRFDDTRTATLAALWKKGICGVINVGCDLSSCVKSLELAEQHEFMYTAVGIHPCYAGGCPSDYLEQLKIFATDQKVKAIGEIGLDYHYDFPEKKVQQRVFIEQLMLAQELSLPVIMHSREATQDLLKCIQQAGVNRGVVHCFSGSPQTAQQLLSMGFHLGFTGVVTFKNAKKVLESAKITPLNRLLLETDCPYLAPMPYRGKICTSDMIAYTADVIAKQKDIDTQSLIDQATQNTKSLFHIDSTASC